MTWRRGSITSDRGQTLHIKSFGQRPHAAGIGAIFATISLTDTLHIATPTHEYK
jgi:hypothetical protein